MPAFQNYYEILGLDAPPQDRKTVKLAYSKKLKVTRPEDDPEGFMRLRDAHDTALDVIAHQTQQAAWQAEQGNLQSAPGVPVETDQGDRPEFASDITPRPDAEPGLSYQDMLPAEPLEPAKTQDAGDTSYSIGPTPSLDAPAGEYRPAPPKTPPLTEELERLLSDPKNYNDRDQWNRLFRNARQLDIDEYVDFEESLLDAVLTFHAYFEESENHDTPEKMPQKLSPSITASLFKTMSWDQINTHRNRRGHQVRWLARRMHVNKQRAASVPVPVPPPDKSKAKYVWAVLIGVYFIYKFILILANS